MNHLAGIDLVVRTTQKSADQLEYAQLLLRRITELMVMSLGLAWPRLQFQVLSVEDLKHKRLPAASVELGQLLKDGVMKNKVTKMIV